MPDVQAADHRKALSTGNAAWTHVEEDFEF